MKKIFTLVGILLLASCTKDDILVEFEQQLEQTNQDTLNKSGTTTDFKNYNRTFTLAKESYLNQRSGISFMWHHQFPYPWGFMPYMGNEDANRGWYGGGQAYGDVNKDGYQDILVSLHKTATNTSMIWFINSGDNRNYKEDASYFNSSTQGINAYKILKTDVNNDNIADYICLGVEETPGNYGGNFDVLIGTPAGKFDVKKINTDGRYWYHTAAAGDLNNDGFVDVVSATFIWYGDGTGNFKKGISIDDNELSYIKSPIAHEILDINKDGYNDLILATVGSLDVTTIVLGKSNGFDKTNKIIKLPKSSHHDIMDTEIIDLDGDGDLDIVELRFLGGGPEGTKDLKYSVSNFIVYWNKNMNFTLDETYFGNDVYDGNYINGTYDQYGWSRFKFDDVDGDGVDEILAENYHDSEYNALKKIDGVWKKVSLTFGK